MAKTLYTTAEIADILQITRQTAYQLIHKDLFKSIKTDKGYRIVKSSLLHLPFSILGYTPFAFQKGIQLYKSLKLFQIELVH